ncbi:pentapeptide repeat-containing protein [Streptomyces rubiginosohelvolus]|uniref:pentapeptide repeat-containing protein n=1 Tax=Streptomyces rubiginosohelvolus TaxID=67362 RepID=UPI0037BA07BF
MTRNRRPRPSLNGRELRLWNVGLVLALALLTALAVAAAVFYTGWDLLGARELKSERRIDSKTLFDLVKLSFGVVAGAGALVALIVAYRRQRVDEAGAHREATRLHTERFSQAVDKLGSDSPAVRLGGVHALAGLADDAPDHNLRQTCIDVLCAYLRLPFPSDPGDLPDPLPDGTSPTEERRNAHQEKTDLYRALREVRHTVLRLIGDHYRIPQGTHRSWQGCDLDLTGVTIDGNIDFSGATFSGGRVSFDRATFSAGEAFFVGATFSGGRVSFVGATFSAGEVSFVGATFSSGRVLFDRATFFGGEVSFDRATFSGGGPTFFGGEVSFDRATFSGGTVSFDHATFSGGDVSFLRATYFGGTVSFDHATFSGGDVHFDRATFSGGRVSFVGATFSGSGVSFLRATFSGGDVHFALTTFSGGDVSFLHATFSDGTVSFDRATGSAPGGLLDAVSTPASQGVSLPSAWLPANP